MNEVYAFDVWVKDTDWHKIVNERTPGRAKREYHRSVIDAWPDIPYTAMRCRKLGQPQTPREFTRTALYRGYQGGEIKCGDRVKAEGGTGVIVGNNSSANFDVLFDADSPRYANQRLNCHPAYIEKEG